jgi:hypothetical protein
LFLPAAVHSGAGFLFLSLPHNAPLPAYGQRLQQPILRSSGSTVVGRMSLYIPRRKFRNGQCFLRVGKLASRHASFASISDHIPCGDSLGIPDNTRHAGRLETLFHIGGIRGYA